VIFPYAMSEYTSTDDLLLVIDDIENLLEEPHDWLPYFPQASETQRTRQGYLYSNSYQNDYSLCKVIKKLSLWCKEKCIGPWQSCLQSEKPVSMGWLLFLTNIMDTETLQQAITKNLQDIPVGLRWKMISLGIQGQVKLEDQVCALHIYVNEMDAEMAKPLLIEMYPSWPSAMHEFPLHIQQHLVPELDTVLNIKGCKNVDKSTATMGAKLTAHSSETQTIMSQ